VSVMYSGSVSPEYWPCPECGNSEFWLLANGQIMCANWPDCGETFAVGWATPEQAQAYRIERKRIAP
jgi:uncharacterized Zn finger protein (UPF0148 family)